MTDEQVVERLLAKSNKTKEYKITHFSDESLEMNNFYCTNSALNNKDWMFVRGKNDKLIFYNKNRVKLAVVLKDDGTVISNRG